MPGESTRKGRKYPGRKGKKRNDSNHVRVPSRHYTKMIKVSEKISGVPTDLIRRIVSLSFHHDRHLYGSVKHFRMVDITARMRLEGLSPEEIGSSDVSIEGGVCYRRIRVLVSHQMVDGSFIVEMVQKFNTDSEIPPNLDCVIDIETEKMAICFSIVAEPPPPLILQQPYCTVSRICNIMPRMLMVGWIDMNEAFFTNVYMLQLQGKKVARRAGIHDSDGHVVSLNSKVYHDILLEALKESEHPQLTRFVTRFWNACVPDEDIDEID